MEAPKKPKSKLLRITLLTLGSIATALGFIGVFLPLLPTTPFLLLAAACFMRSSDKFYEKLIGNRILGSYILDYREKRGMRRRNKFVSIFLLWAAISYSIYAVEGTAIRLILVAIALAVTVHIITLKRILSEKKENIEQKVGEKSSDIYKTDDKNV